MGRVGLVPKGMDLQRRVEAEREGWGANRGRRGSACMMEF